MGKQNYIQLIKNTQGVSMIIALALLTIISIIALTSTTLLTNAIRGNIEFGTSAKAEYASYSAKEMGLALSNNIGLGTNVGDADNQFMFCIQQNSLGDLEIAESTTNNCDGQLIEYYVTSSAIDLDPDGNDSVYIIPPPGEGDAGENCERPNNYSEPNNDSQDLEANLLKPCNWNKLHFGETASIPLYQENSAGDAINPAALNMTEFTLKVRTPCVNGILYANGELDGDPLTEAWCDGLRYELAQGATPQEEIIVHWEIVGDCTYVGTDQYDGTCVGLAVSEFSNSSEITYNTINMFSSSSGASKYAVLGSLNPFFRNKVLDLNTDWDQSTIVNYLKSTENELFLEVGASSRTLDSPTLNLAVVSPLIDAAGGGSVPYIEYQIQTDAQISDSFQTVHSTGSTGNFQSTQKSKKENASTNINFVIQN